MYYTIFAKREENFLAKIDVAPLAGARIEMSRPTMTFLKESSLPSRERGLKSQDAQSIELEYGRSPRGSAD